MLLHVRTTKLAFSDYILFVTCRPGSVFASVELVFGKLATDPLKPLQDEVNGKLGSFTAELDLNPTITPPTSSNTSKFKYVYSVIIN